MLVYGSQEYQEPLSAMLQHLAARAASTRPDSLDDLRTLLIQLGQLEQGVADGLESGAPIDPQLVQAISRLTEQAARLFLHTWNEETAALASASTLGLGGLAALSDELRRLQGPQEATLTVKIPEGFEYYTLFPEQYCLSALRWSAAHASAWPRKVLVVGIRSIGTTLSALVAAVLAAQGWQVQRRTMRPTGHPFARVVTLEKAGLEAVRCAVVVDEGPGLSGSSMAATARALSQAGIRNLSFLPGHGGEPGSAANPETRRWWAETPRYVAALADFCWGGLEIQPSLAARTRVLLRPNGAAGPEDTQDLSGGLWRQRAFTDETAWPAALARFERIKYLCAPQHGNAVLWKFAGLGCAWQGGKTSLETAIEQMAVRRELGLVPEVLDSFRGFVAIPWIDGTRPRSSELCHPAVLAHAARYLQHSAGLPLTEAEAAASLARLKEMLYANTREALGEARAEQARGWAERISPSAPLPAYGDGRLAPHEWVRTATGVLLKTDPTGHDLDHTLVGKQSLLWDVAGLLVEWDLDANAAAPLLSSLADRLASCSAVALAFYQMSYAAFRLGLTTLCAGELPPKATEGTRLVAAADTYRRTLQQLINQLPS